MIRLASEEDTERIVEMGLRFLETTSYAEHLKGDPVRMTEIVKILIGQKSLLLLTAEEQIIGMLGYVVHNHFLSGVKTFGEVFWWVEPEERGKGIWLLKEVERRAREAKATCIQMIAPTEEVETVYERFGYKYVESTYQKNL